jgi:hypothetical protein
VPPRPPTPTTTTTATTTTTTASAAPQMSSPSMPTPQAIASALTNSPTAADKLKDTVISPDKIVRGTQSGSTVLGSFDDRDICEF